MKRSFLVFLLTFLALFSLTACSGQIMQSVEPLHYYDLYPSIKLPQEELDYRAKMREVVYSSLPDDMREQEPKVWFSNDRLDITVPLFDERIKSIPNDWETKVEYAQGLAANVCAGVQSDSDLEPILYFSDSRYILLTIRDGQLVYNRFARAKQPGQTKDEQPEAEYSSPSEVDRDELHADLVTTGDDSELSVTVYVSARSKTIHSISDCSGMKRYTVMLEEDAVAEGYRYCPNCW
nr:hypothetical protein [uncultured Oscillibacter sp.]